MQGNNKVWQMLFINVLFPPPPKERKREEKRETSCKIKKKKKRQIALIIREIIENIQTSYLISRAAVVPAAGCSCQADTRSPRRDSAVDRNWVQGCPDCHLDQDGQQENSWVPLQKPAMEEESETMTCMAWNTSVSLGHLFCPVHPVLSKGFHCSLEDANRRIVTSSTEKLYILRRRHNLSSRCSWNLSYILLLFLQWIKSGALSTQINSSEVYFRRQQDISEFCAKHILVFNVLWPQKFVHHGPPVWHIS